MSEEIKEPFHVMDWLRSVRDRNAETERGLSPEQILERERAEKEAAVARYLKAHPDARIIRPDDSPNRQVAENSGDYNRDDSSPP